MSKRKVPIIAIVGRANVGKSSLFNSLIGRREAIVAKEAGTTRDNVVAKISYGSKDAWLVDTAGLKDPTDDFEMSIQEQIVQAAADADLIMVVIEAHLPITHEDRRVAKLALKSRKSVLLVVNKLDQLKASSPQDWPRLGIGQILQTSVTQKRGISELRQAIFESVGAVKVADRKDLISLAILGRPNVGKSSLFNSLANKQQALVAARAGTTRDVNRVSLQYKQRPIEVLDTAGIRRSGKIEQGVERFSVLRSLAAIEEADIGVLVMDAGELNVQLDQKIAGLIKDAGRGLILAVSKWDQMEKDAHTRDELAREIAANFSFVPWAPLLFTSAVTGQNVSKLFDLALEIAAARATKISTSQLNSWLRAAVDEHPPAGLKNRTPKLNYIVQEDDMNFPNFRVYGSHSRYLHWSYKRYLERKFRERWPLAGTPLKFWFLEKH